MTLGKLLYLTRLPKITLLARGRLGFEQKQGQRRNERKEKKERVRESNGTAVSEPLKSTCKVRFSPLWSIPKRKKRERGKKQHTAFPLYTMSFTAINYCGLLHLLITKVISPSNKSRAVAELLNVIWLIYNASALGSHFLTQRFTVRRPLKKEATYREEMNPRRL